MADSTNGVNGRSAPNGRASYAERNKVADHFIGGNRLSNAAASKVKDFVAENDGHTVITNVRTLHGDRTLLCAQPLRPLRDRSEPCRQEANSIGSHRS